MRHFALVRNSALTPTAAAGGSVFYSGFNGRRLGDIVNLVYTGSFSSDTDTAAPAPRT